MHVVFEKFDSLAEQAKHSLDNGYGFFGQTAWFELIIRHVYPKRTGFLIAKESEGQLAYICPAHFDLGWWRLRTFYSLTCFYTPLYKIVAVEQPNTQQSYLNFFQALQQSSLRWHRLILQGLPQADVDALTQILVQTGTPAFGFFCFANWYLPVVFKNYQEYFAKRSSRVRNTVRRKSQVFHRQANSRIVLYVSEDQLNQACQDYIEVYNDSWKQQEAYPQFIPDLLRLAARQGSLRLAIAYLGTEPIAAQFWIVADHTAYIYKLAYKEAYKALGVGTVLTALLMQHVIDVDQVETVDYLTGDDAYKADWMTQRRERWGVVVFNRSTILGSVLYWLEKLKRMLKTKISLPHDHY